jgi:dienelactone hydrolase
MIRRLTFSALFFLLAAPAAAASAPTAGVSFEYDRTVPLEVTTQDTQLVPGGVRVDEITYRSGDATTRASLVHPQDDGNAMPAVLFVHGRGDADGSNRNEFLADAEWLARRGVVSLVPDQPWSSDTWAERSAAAGSRERASMTAVVALRRAIDVLVASPGVDERKIAYVGYDLGAEYGALLASVETRIAYYVFMAPSVVAPAEMGGFDIAAALGRANPKAALVQIPTRDASVTKAQSEEFATALPATGRTVGTYADGHTLTGDAVADDRRSWLAARFGL